MAYLFLGSTFGLTLRMFIKRNFQIKFGFFINNVSLINFLASLFLGVIVAINPVNKKLFLLLYFGFLGSFSTFSSFIYQLFFLLSKREFMRSFLHYVEVILLSYMFFYIGYYLIKIFQ